GVQCSAYAHSAGIDGVCTILRVEFPGWTKSEVRGVIGESGTGWCVLEETSTVSESGDEVLSDTSSILSGISTPPCVYDCMKSALSIASSEDSTSFMMPTLDFSAAFLDAASAPDSSPSPIDRSETIFDMSSDSESSLDSWSELSDGEAESFVSG